MRFAKWTYTLAGVYGLLVTLPLFFTERQYSTDHPPAITHPEFFYGFAGLCLAWQLVFLLIGSDPLRYRPLMPVSWVEKFSYVIAIAFLYPMGRAPAVMVAAAAMDGLLGILFVAAFVRTRAAARVAPPAGIPSAAQE